MTRRTFSGADAFTRVLDREARRGGWPGFVSYALLELSEKPDADALRAALAADTPFARTLRATVTRSPSFEPCWDVDRLGPPATVGVLDAPPAGASPWPELLRTRLDPRHGRHMSFTLFPAGDGTWRAGFVFHHFLLDAKAAERVLVGLDRGASEARWPEPRSLLDGMAFKDVALAARRRINAMEAATQGAMHVAVPDVAGGPASLGAEAVLFDESRTRAAVDSGRRAAGYAMEGLWYLACLLAAIEETSPTPAPRGSRYVVPLPTSLDRKQDAGRAFGNHLLFLFLAVAAADARDPAATARAFRDAVLEDLRSRADRDAQAQLEFCRRIPLPIYSWLAKRTMGGGLGSVFFTNPGPVDPALETFFGARITELRHFPMPTPSPGLCGAVWSRGGRLGLSLTWSRARFSDGRARELLSRWSERIVSVPA